jgi:drug/metabolite transporter (DMT)-like permease
LSLKRRLATIRHAWLKLPGNTRGALWVLLAGLLFTAMAVMVKSLGARLDSFQVAFFRALFGLMAVLPFLWGSRIARLRTRRPVMHVIRGFMGVSAMLCGFYSITHLSLADATALSFTRPLFLVVLSVFFLGEVVRARRWTATALGFLGMVIMMRPGGAVDHAAFVALAGAMLVAGVSILVKKMTVTENAVAMLFYFGIISTSVALIPAILVWQTPTWAELAMMMAVGMLAAGGQSFMIRAFAVAEASAISPFDYVRIVYAALFGLALFGEVPDGWTLTGAAIIVASTLYIAQREAAMARRQGGADRDEEREAVAVAARTVNDAAGVIRVPLRRDRKS